MTCLIQVLVSALLRFFSIRKRMAEEKDAC